MFNDPDYEALSTGIRFLSTELFKDKVTKSIQLQIFNFTLFIQKDKVAETETCTSTIF